MTTEWWVDPAVLQWHVFVQSWNPQDINNVRRAYRHWDHAERLVRTASDEFQLVDVITTLKRAVDQRLRQLNDIYKWKTVPVRDIPKGALQRLEALGVVRHRMLERLFTIRNGIEHADRRPPQLSECEELVEFAWYFLKSTDVLASRAVSEIVLDRDDDLEMSPGIELRLDHKESWSIEARGTLPPRLLSLRMHDDWIRINVTRIESRGDFVKRRRSESAAAPLIEKYVDDHAAREPSDLLFEGHIAGPSERILDFVRMFLTAV